MLFVKTKVAKSKIHGLGLFAEEFVSKGALIWRFTPGFDLRFSREEILEFPRLLQDYLSKYAWKSKKSGLYCFASDNDKYCNHCDDPNALSEYIAGEEEVVTKAVRDIYRGEEITENYSTFEDYHSDDNVLDEIAQGSDRSDHVDGLAKTR